ncbi:ATP-binding cassette domain-containing protein [bacterium]|nr:ATP-binding cassette domain-containing protein [bacterium]
MIDVKGISKRYGSTLAVDDVSFTVNRGEIVGFLGPNGAGKSTTMKVLTCYLAPNSGTATIDGHDIIEEPLKVRAKVGYLPENTPLYDEMGVIDFLHFMAQLQGVPSAERSKRVDELIDRCDIGPMAHKDISELSRGFRQRVGLAQAMLHDPPVLILDEPTSGLDPAQIVEIRELIKDIAGEKAILLSTHILPEAQNTCNRILIINQGRIVGEGTSEELLSMASGEESYTVALKGAPAGDMAYALSTLPKVNDVDTLGENGAIRFRLSAEQGADLSENIFDMALEKGLKLLELHHSSTSLEDVFLQLTGSPAGAASAEPDAETLERSPESGVRREESTKETPDSGSEDSGDE